MIVTAYGAGLLITSFPPSVVRMFMAKRRLHELRRQRAATNIQKTVRAWRARVQYQTERKALLYVQKVFMAKREKR